MKGFTLFLSMIALLAAGVSGLLYIMAGNEKGDLSRELATANTQLTEARARINELTTERTDLAAQLQKLEVEVNELKARNTTLEARNAQLAREISGVRDQLGDRAAADQAASRRIAELTRELTEAQAAAKAGAGNEEVAAYQARIVDLEAEIAALRHGTSTLNFASADPLANVPANLTGNVIDVGPKAAFVVLDIGTRNGAAPSLEMVLRRGAVVIARVRLTEVKETYSVAHVLPRSGSGNVRPGDTASRS
jgi:hypothetical protein